MGRARIAIVTSLVVVGPLLWALRGYFSQASAWPPTASSLAVGPVVRTAEALGRVKARPLQASIVVEPAQGKIRVYQKIRCHVTFSNPQTDPLPTFLYAVLRARGAEYRRGQLTLSGQHADDCTVDGTVRAPSKAGKYRLVIEAVYILQPDKTENGSPRTAVDSLFRIELPGPEIQVVP